VQTRVTVKFLTGMEMTGKLKRAFHPENDFIELAGTEGSGPQRHQLDTVAYIKLFGKAELAEGSEQDLFFEKITTVTGERFHLRLLRNQGFASGFYGYPNDADSDFSAIFITSSGLSQHHHDHPLGQVLLQQGAVEAAALDTALDNQRALRQKRVGEILTEQHSLSKNTVERTLQSAQHQGSSSCSRVGEILIEAGLVTRQQVDEALAIQATEKRKRIGTILMELGMITEEQLLSALAQKFGLQVVDLDRVTPSPEALKCLPQEILVKMQVLPLEIRRKRLVVATANPTDPVIAQNLRFAANLPIELVVASGGQIAAQIAKLVTARPSGIEELIDGLDNAEVQILEEQELDHVNESDSKVINLVNKVLLDAHRRGVSDIHFEPGMGALPLKIRYRKDGVCTQVHQISATFKAAILSRIKIIAKLDIAERRRPQSGKILLKHGRERIEYRVEVTPTIGGQEDAVLRVLSSAQIFPLEQIGFSTRNLERMREALNSCISEINTPDRKIWTAEDPVEITQEGLRQVQVHSKIGFTFEEALRSFLRADPDVIMIGEMRDPVTAKTAIGASLTGHLVFSTLHTNSAAETVVRLIEMGMDPFNFADAMLTIVAQRLARRLCTDCNEPYHPARVEYDELVEAYGREQFRQDKMPPFSAELTLMRAKGCEKCEGTGYRGRIAVHEQLVNSPPIRQAIKDNAGVEKILSIAMAQGMSTLRMDGIQKIFLGLTDFKQISRVIT